MYLINFRFYFYYPASALKCFHMRYIVLLYLLYPLNKLLYTTNTLCCDLNHSAGKITMQAALLIVLQTYVYDWSSQSFSQDYGFFHHIRCICYFYTCLTNNGIFLTNNLYVVCVN